MANHIAAIHTLKAKLKLTDDDYRALLFGLTGQRSSKDMSAAQQGHVRDHLQVLVGRAAGKPTFSRRNTFASAKAAATPQERKVWALWNQLHRDGVLRDRSAQALNAWVKRTVHVDALRFATGAQLDTLIESLKAWQARGSEV